MENDAEDLLSCPICFERFEVSDRQSQNHRRLNKLLTCSTQMHTRDLSKCLWCSCFRTRDSCTAATRSARSVSANTTRKEIDNTSSVPNVGHPPNSPTDWSKGKKMVQECCVFQKARESQTECSIFFLFQQFTEGLSHRSVPGCHQTIRGQQKEEANQLCHVQVRGSFSFLSLFAAGNFRQSQHLEQIMYASQQMEQLENLSSIGP